MDVGMMALIVKGGIPFQMIHGDLQAIGQSLCLCPEHIPPPDAGIETEALRIFSAQRNNKCPHISLMSIQLLGYLFQLYLDTIIREQPMVAEPFRTGPGADVVGIGFLVQDLMGIVLNGTGDKFRGGSHGLFSLVVLIFQHRSAIREIPQDLFNEFLLFHCCGSQLERLIDLLHTFTGGDVGGVPADGLFLIRLQVFEFGDQTSHGKPPSVLE